MMITEQLWEQYKQKINTDNISLDVLSAIEHAFINGLMINPRHHISQDPRWDKVKMLRSEGKHISANNLTMTIKDDYKHLMQY